MNLHPFEDSAKNAQSVVNKGGTIFQQFICSSCGTKQTMSEPNKFFTHGICEECKEETDLRKNGCNFMAMFSNPLK